MREQLRRHWHRVFNCPLLPECEFDTEPHGIYTWVCRCGRRQRLMITANHHIVRLRSEK